MGNASSGIVLAVTIAAAFLMLLPVIVVASKGRLPLQIAALLLCCLAAAALLGGGVAGAAFSGVTLIVALPVSAGLWFAGLFCALAAWSDAAQERRAKEMTVRLLMNDAHGLGKPDDYRIGWLG
jgi:hypothetical protein